MSSRAPLVSILLLIWVKSALSTTCQPGFHKSSNNTCIQCPPTWYQPLPDQTNCIPCPIRHIAPRGSIECIPCKENEIEKKNRCDCRAGFQRNSTNDCEPCPAGSRHQKYGDYRGRTPTGCIQCSPGWYQPLQGQTSCTKCPDGEMSGRGASSCIACEPGTVPLDRETRCGLCPPGYGFILSCDLCTEGTFKSGEGQTKCMPCPEGQTSSKGASKCAELCPGGSLPLPNGTCQTQSCTGNTAPLSDGSCGRCQPGTHYNSTAQTCVKCGPNTFSNCWNLLGECIPCRATEFAGEGASECQSCPPGEVFVRNSTCVRCTDGTWYDREALECKLCPANTYGSGGDEIMYKACIRCPEGTYSRPGSRVCFYCPFGEVYDDTMGECTSSCPAGRFYVHPNARCELCDDRKFKNNTRIEQCIHCPRAFESTEDHTSCFDPQVNQ